MKTRIKLPAGVEVESIRFLNNLGEVTTSTLDAVEVEVEHRFLQGRSYAACLLLTAGGLLGRRRSSVLTVSGKHGKFRVQDLGENVATEFDEPAPVVQDESSSAPNTTSVLRSP